MGTDEHLDEIFRAGTRDGLLPEGATAAVEPSRPWPVLLLTALGAWLAAIPLIAMVATLLRDMFERGIGPYFAGVMFIAAAVVVLRSREVPVFVEQLAIPALLTGGGLLAIGAFRDLPGQVAAALLCAVALGVASAVPRAWLRVLLGAAAGIFAAMVLLPSRLFALDTFGVLTSWIAVHASLLVVIAAMAGERHLRSADLARVGAALESIATGWLVAAIAMLAWWAGRTFLVGGVLDAGMSNAFVHESTREWLTATWAMRAGSVALALVAGAVLAKRWPSLRNPRSALVFVVLAGLCGFMTMLGGALFALAFAATTRRWRVAAFAAVAVAWIIGAFYYRLDWPLADKAAVLVVAGALLAATAWSARGTPVPGAAVRRSAGGWAAPAWIASAAAVTLALANYSIYEKEQLIAHGDKVYVPLAPVDPRSLMQGDYMRLNYRLPAETDSLDKLSLHGRPFVVVKRDARGVAQPLRIVKTREPLPAGEMHIELTPHEGGWVLVSDAWHFPEGDGQRWLAARYAEFRVLPDGRALLVGLADANLKPIAAKP